MRHILKQVLLFLILAISCNSAYADERYSVKMVENGNMYFFMPVKIKGKSGCRLEYDMTLLSFCDSVSINMTLTSPLGHVQSVRLSSAEVSYSTEQYEIYFQERKGSRFNTRIHIDCPVKEYRQVFSGETPLVITITMSDGKEYSFAYKSSKWKKEKGYVIEVLEIIDYANSRQE